MLSGKSFIYIKKVVYPELDLEGNLIQHLSIFNVDRLTLFRMGFFGAAHGWSGGGGGGLFALKSSTHILQ